MKSLLSANKQFDLPKELISENAGNALLARLFAPPPPPPQKNRYLFIF
jgi:hypothetical protein